MRRGGVYLHDPCPPSLPRDPDRREEGGVGVGDGGWLDGNG